MEHDICPLQCLKGTLAVVPDHVLYSHCRHRLINWPWLSMKERGPLWLKNVQLEKAGSFSPSLCHFSLSSGSRNSVKCTWDTMLIKTAAVCCLASGGRRASTRRRSLCWLATQHVWLHLQRPALGSIQGCVASHFGLLCLSLNFSHYASPSHSPLLCFSLLSYSTLSSLFPLFSHGLMPRESEQHRSLMESGNPTWPPWVPGWLIALEFTFPILSSPAYLTRVPVTRVLPREGSLTPGLTLVSTPCNCLL